ncbi:hypothetical protein IWX46DRAFT_42984 [Phyllosticta citricarpa]|uniref:ABM domain-containing protein n=1 Tax=Phyllosticta citricarpa TaxID=55181 RepID=A0ABR1MGT7_9PEZI
MVETFPCQLMCVCIYVFAYSFLSSSSSSSSAAAAAKSEIFNFAFSRALESKTEQGCKSLSHYSAKDASTPPITSSAAIFIHSAHRRTAAEATFRRLKRHGRGTGRITREREYFESQREGEGGYVCVTLWRSAEMMRALSGRAAGRFEGWMKSLGQEGKGWDGRE